MDTETDPALARALRIRDAFLASIAGQDRSAWNECRQCGDFTEVDAAGHCSLYPDCSED